MPEPASLSGWFGMAQLKDPNLSSALQEVKKVEAIQDWPRPLTKKQI